MVGERAARTVGEMVGKLENKRVEYSEKLLVGKKGQRLVG